MELTDRFVLSHHPYAIRPPAGALKWLNYGHVHRTSLDVVYYRGPLRELSANHGDLSIRIDVERVADPTSLSWEEVLELALGKPSRHFLDTFARLRAGGDLWTAGLLFPRQRIEVDLLQPMLDNYPSIPEGFVGWWK